MTKLCFLFLLCALLCGCGASPQKEGDATTAISKVETNAADEAVVTLDTGAQKRIELKVAPVTAATHSIELTAYGSVLDPSPLISAQGDLASNEASVEVAKTLAVRAHSLFEQGENVSRKAMESADADLRAAEIKLETARRSLELDWGDAIAKLDAPGRNTLLDDLASRKAFLARVDLPAGKSIDGLPSAARVSDANEKQWWKAALLSPATKTDPKTFGQGFFLRIDDVPLQINAPLKALLELTNAPRAGFAIPDAAVLRSDGKTWVYIQVSTNSFARREIILEAPVEQGWFTMGGVAAGDQLVVTGGELLLSEEHKSQIKVD